MIVGIDLGTTNSLVAVWRDGKATIIPNALGRPLTPSCVGLMDDGTLSIGEAAKERLQTHPDKTASLFKRYMGTNRQIRLGPKSYRPEELSSFVLRVLKADAEAFLGETITEAIITVPAYFSDAQRKATRIAGELAGLRVDRLLNEPTAAALAYGLQNNDESKFLVFDLGGGTFDVSILELFEGVMEVRASAGDNFLGGEDFVTLLMDTFIARTGFAKKAGLDSKQLPPEIQQRLRAIAERVKCALTDQPSATMQMEVKGETYTLELSQEEFQNLSEPLLDRLRQPVERALRDARIMPSALNNIVLAGGATRMPMVRRMVSRMFGRFPVVDLNPDELIALGAAVQAGLKMRDATLEEVVMTDVSPYTMGMEVSRSQGPNQIASGFYLPVIERNCVVPVSKVTRVNTMADNQKMVNLRVFQGECPMVSDNVFLGELHIPVPPRRAGEVELDIRFTYDVNGLLEAEAIVVETGAKHSLVIEENPGVMTSDEIKERLHLLDAIKIHPRDQTENRAVMARAERLYQQLLGGSRDRIGEAIATFQFVLNQQDADPIREARIQMKHLLDQMEGAPIF
jgi:molecular chaperone HscC